MKILLVNGHSPNYNGHKRFDDYALIIKEIFTKQRMSMVSFPDVIVRDRSNLDDYLYEPNTKYQSAEARKLFDYVDLVFIDGDGSVLPWFKKCDKIKILFKMDKVLINLD